MNKSTEGTFVSERGGYRNPSIDILKGLAIVLVVYGHTWPSSRDFIYLFHVSVFMMASGYCFAIKITDGKSLIKYWIRKSKSLYFPYVFWNELFLLGTNFFLKIGFLTNQSEFLKLTMGYPLTQVLTNTVGLKEFLVQSIKIILLGGTTQFGTATWFLGNLLLVLIIHSTVSYLITDNKNNIDTLVVLCVIMLLLSWIIGSIGGLLPGCIQRFPCMYFAFLLGEILKKLKIFERKTSISKQMIVLLLSMVVLLTLLFMGERVELSGARIGNPLLYAIACLAGWSMLYSLSSLISHIYGISKVLSFVGRNTMAIIVLHVISFKLVSYVWIMIYKQPRVLLASHHIIFYVNEIWKLIYLVVGISVPLIVVLVHRTVLRARNG